MEMKVLSLITPEHLYSNMDIQWGVIKITLPNLSQFMIQLNDNTI